MNYDPNLTNSGNMADQVVQLTFARWDYRLVVEVTVGGNCTGLSVIRAAVSNFFDTLPFKTYGTHEISSVVLTKPNGDALEDEDEDEDGDDWLGEMLIKAEIVSIAPQVEK